MKSRGGFAVITSVCSGLLSLLFGCYPAAENFPQDQIDSNQTQKINKNNQFTPSELSNKIETYLDQLEESGFSGAVLVAQNNKIVFEKGYGLADRKNKIPITSQTVFDSGSLSKQFTATAILHLEEQGQLQLEDTLAKFFDDVPSDKANITLHQLLTNSSGLPEYADEGDFAKTSRKQGIKLAFNAKLEFQPGTDYLYSNAGYGLLAAIVEITSGKSFQTYLKQNLFEPAGMLHTGFYNDPQWENLPVARGYNNDKDLGSAATRPGPYWGVLGSGGVLTTVGDLYLWNVALENNLILSQESTKKLFTPHIKEDKDGKSYYGYGWAVENIPRQGKMISHDGAGDSHNGVFIKYGDANNTLVVVLSNRIDEKGLFRKTETFYGIDTGRVLGSNILENDFSKLPEYARSQVKS